MRIATRLLIVSTSTIAALVVLAPILIWSFAEFRNAKVDYALADEIVVNFFERTSFSDQYFLYREDRAQAQWEESKDAAYRLLRQADIQFNSEDDRQTLLRLRRNIEDTAAIFHRIVANTDVMSTAVGNSPVYRELDKRLYSQLLLKAAAVRNAAISLQDASQQRVEQTYLRMNIIIALFAITLASAIVLVSKQIRDLLRKRLLPLHDGTRIIAGGDLAFRIKCEGSDEFSELGQSINTMTAQLYGIAKKLEAEMEERKQTEQKLRAASHYARSLIEASLDPLVTISPDGKITDVNEATVKVTGLERETLVGTDFSSYFTDPQMASSGYREVFEKGFVTDYPLTIRHKYGHLTDVLYNASVYRDAGGQVLGVFAAARDITERKRASEAANAERQRFYDVLEQLPVYVILLSPDYHVPFANRFFRERFGEARGRRCYEYLFGRSEPCPVCETFTVFKTNASHEWEWTGPDGRQYSIFDRPFKDTDGSPLILEVGIDVTDQKQAEADVRRLNVSLERRVRERTAELEATNKELEAFAYSVSHDLRAPLRSIDGFSQALLEDYADKLDDEGKDDLRRVRAASQRMGQLIDDLLKLSRLSRSEMTFETVELSALASSIVEELRAGDPGRGANVVVAPGIEARGDKRLLAVVLENLLGNAWKFTGKRATARIEFGSVKKDGEPAYFVRDNGAGFDMSHVGNLYAPFQRLHSVADFPGTGIGLATVRRIVQRHGGRVWAEGSVGQGATFYFTLSTALAEGDHEHREAAQA